MEYPHTFSFFFFFFFFWGKGTITGAVEFCDLILLKSARSLATTFCFVKGEPLRSLRPVPGNQYSQFDRIHGLLPAGAPVVHATGHRLRIVLWRILRAIKQTIPTNPIERRLMKTACNDCLRQQEIKATPFVG